MKIKGAIFDLDGTLLDSMFIWDRIGEDYLISRGITPKEALKERFKSMSLIQAAEHYRQEYGICDSIQEICDGVNGMIEHLYKDQVLPKEGAADYLRLLKEQGVKMCVATATDRHLAQAALKRTGLMAFFSEIFTCTEVGFGKDQPAIYHAAAAHLGTAIDETLVFEDALYAITTAKAAGFRVVGVWDPSEDKHTKEIQRIADIYIQSYHEMRDYLDQKGTDHCRL